MTLIEFASPRIRPTLLPPLIAALALTLAVMFPLLSPLMIGAMADVLFAALVLHGLLAAQLPAIYAFAIAVLTFAQSGIFLSAMDRAGSVWLALAVYCVASTATAFVKHRDARRVILLGGALSLAQLLDPMGAILAIFLLPVCVGLPRPGEGKDKAGLLALLLFMPIVTAAILAYARGVLGLNPMSFVRSARPVSHTPFAFIAFAGFASAPGLWLTVLVSNLRKPAALIALFTAVVAIVEILLTFTLGIERDMASILAAIAAASPIAIGAWPRPRKNAPLALAATALAAVISWLLIYLPDAVA
ncbi:MAG TPA: hypothetical protein VMS78_00235 [Rhizomicrobium sp.]|nr:hypothetical protein [Rhizomicrobium sp.]